MRLRLILALVVILTLVGGTAAQAGPIVVRPLDSSRPGEYSNFADLPLTPQQVADQFQLAQTATIESITWYGRYDGRYSVTNPVAFSIRLFADDLGEPAAGPSMSFEVSVSGVAQGSDYLGSPWLAYSTAGLSWTLGPGTYWLSILENDPRTPIGGDSQWLWGDSGPGYRAIRNGDGGDWTAGRDFNHAFTLEGTVPDAGSTLLLFGISLVGLRAWRKRA